MSGEHDSERLPGFRKYRTVEDTEVLRQEQGEIAHRRKEAVAGGQLNDIPESADVPNSLVGLAFSGGGIRSGATCLGVLKALKKTRLLGFVDYMSTVSGGGYAGAWLSSAGLCADRTQTTQKNGAQNSTSMLSALDGGEQLSERMRKFIFGGHYLMRTQRFLNRYLAGLLLLWVVTVSGLATVALLLAIAFRSLDSTFARNFLSGLGFVTDVHRAFFPVVVVLLFWLGCWGMSYFRDRTEASGRVARYVLLLLFVTFAVTVAALMGNGEFGMDWLSADTGVDASVIAVGTKSALQYLLYGVIGIGLLPYLSPSRLIRSGTAPAKISDRWIFAISSRVVVYGIPFLMVSWFAREDISDWSTHRYTPQNIQKDVKEAVSGAAKDVPDGPFPVDPFVAITQGEFVKWSSWSPAWSPFWSAVKEQAQETTTSTFTDWLVASPLWSHLKQDGLPLVIQPVEPQRVLPATLIWRRLETVFLKNNSELGIDGRFAQLQEDQNRMRDILDCVDRASGRKQTDDGQQPPASVAPVPVQLLPGPLHRLSSRAVSLLTYPDSHFKPEGSNRLRDFIARRQGTERIRIEIAAQLDALLKTRSLLFCDWDAHAQLLDEADREQLQSAISTTRRFYAAHGIPGPSESETVAADLWSKADVSSVLANKNFTERERFEFAMVNRDLLSAAFPGTIVARDVVKASNVQRFDQDCRWNWFLCAAAVFALCGFLVNVNATGLHGFYVRGIAENWIEPVPGLGRRIPLSQLETTNEGLPYHLIGASAHWLGRRYKSHGETQRDHFLFSKLFCGCRKTGFTRSEEYMDGTITLSYAAAVSGAALSPLQHGNPLVRALLWLANLRMGQWVENPRHCSYLPSFLRKFSDVRLVTPLRLLVRAGQHAEDRPHFFVTDGGHHENLGIGALLKRRCRVILAIDAGQDGDYQFADLSELIRWSRVKHGVLLEPVERPDGHKDADDKSSLLWNDVAPKSDDLRLDQSRLSARHFVLLRVKYPELPNDAAWMVYVKSSLTGDEPIDLIRYAESDKEFPHNATADQFYLPDRFEAYRQLGEHMVDAVVRELPAWISADEKRGSQPHPYVRAMMNQLQQGAADPTSVMATDIETDNQQTDPQLEELLTQFRDADKPYAEREQSAVLLCERLSDEPKVLPAFLQALGDSDAVFRNLVLNMLRETDIVSSGDVLLRDGLKAKSWRIREGVCTLLADLLRAVADPDASLVECLLEVAEPSAKPRKAEQLAALNALSACRRHVSDESLRARIDTLINSSRPKQLPESKPEQA